MSTNEQSQLLEAIDQIQVMLMIEERYTRCDYSQYIACSSDKDGIKVDSECRRKMIEWCFQVVGFYDMEKEIVIVGMTYVDIYLGKLVDKSILNNRKKYQLLVMTSIYLATKVFGTKVIDINLLVSLGRGTYLKEEFEDMENDMLAALQWRVHPPTPTSFVRQLLLVASMLNADENFSSELLRLCCFQIEKGLYNYEVSLKKPSVVAVSAIMNAFDHQVFDTFSSDIKSNFIEKLLVICKIDMDAEDLETARFLLYHEISPSSNFLAPWNSSESPQANKYTSSGSMVHSPISVGRQPQRYVSQSPTNSR